MPRRKKITLFLILSLIAISFATPYNISFAQNQPRIIITGASLDEESTNRVRQEILNNVDKVAAYFNFKIPKVINVNI